MFWVQRSSFPYFGYGSISVGNAISVSELRDDVVSAYKQEVDWSTNEMLRPYKKMFERRKVLSQALNVKLSCVFFFLFSQILKNVPY